MPTPHPSPLPLILWGATGQARVLRELTGHLGYRVIAVFDNNPDIASPFTEVPVYHTRAGFEAWRAAYGDAECACLVAIGGAHGRARVDIQRWLESTGLTPVTVVHPTAFVAADVTMGRGTQILPRAAVTVEATLGQACIVNTAASVDHECQLGDGVHVAPGATLAGCVRVGSFSMIGAGAVVLPRISIGSNTIVGAGAVVTRDLPDNVVAYGNPARVIRVNS